ncbi:MAG: IPT/TIG domain-containing protein [Gammaproteobacteria bacterium]
MLNITAKALLALVGLTSFGYTAIAAGPGSARAAQTPVILSAMVDSNEHTMVISGNYFGAVRPTVRLGDRVMNVESFSPNQVTVTLPPNIQAATYSLTVTANRPYPLTSNMFSAALFATADRY